MNEHELRTLDAIRILRRDNNDFWMKIVQIALTHAPEETRAAMREIAAMDKGITRCWEALLQ